MSTNIEQGDYVRHKTPIASIGLRMTVIDTDDDSAQCSYFYGSEQIHKTEWFPFADLELVQKADGGFIE